MRNIGIFTLTLNLSFALVSFGAKAAEGFCGIVPLSSQSQQATDLIYNGQTLSPDQVQGLLAQPNGSDLVSQLNPSDQSNVWSNTVGGPLDSSKFTLGVPEKSSAKYVTDVLSVIGQYRSMVSIVDGQGLTQTYNLVLNKNIHNYLLRKALLEKLGYAITPVQYVRNISVQFAGTFDRKAFIDNVTSDLMTPHPERWITNLSDTGLVLNLQDVVLVPSNLSMFDLADIIPDSIPQGRRLFNGLVVPYALTNVPESVNAFPWVAGEIFNNQMVLPCPNEDGFNAAFEDEKWMARRLSQLSRADFQDVVAASQYPPEVAQLMVEKLISRRNTLMPLSQLKVANLPVNNKISASDSKLLKNGQLPENKTWPGYGTQFSGVYPDDPISGPQIRNFLLSRLYGSLINTGVNAVNAMMTTNISKIINNHESQLLNDQINNFLTTGQMKAISTGVYRFPTHAGSMVLSRDIVVGSYMGSDNLIQLADNIGLSFKLGIGGVIDGISLPVVLNSDVMVSRIYTHLRPLKTIKAALNSPYKNLAVPLMEKNFASILDPVLKLPVSDDLSNDQIKVVQDALNNLDNAMTDGESVVVTDTVGGDLGVQAQYALTAPWTVTGGISDTQMIIRRMQILKQPNHQFQIYYDPGTMNELGIGISLGAYNVPLVTLSYNRAKGHVTTNFFTLDLSTDTQKYSKVLKNIAALRQTLLDNSTSAVKAQKQIPYQFEHHFKQSSTDFGILFYQNKRLKTTDHISAVSPEGFHQDYFYQSTGTRGGKDYQTLILNILQGYIKNKTGNSDASLDTTNSGNPADTIKGSAVSRNVNVVTERDAGSPRTTVDNMYIDISHLHRGWSISKKKALSVLGEFNKTYGVNLLTPEWLNDTDKIELYAFGLDTKIYNQGISYLAHLTPQQFEKYLLQYGDFPSQNPDSNTTNQDVADHITYDFKKFVEAFNSGDAEKAAGLATKVIDQVEAILPGTKLVNLVGGTNNVFIAATVNGFRTTDENGDAPLNSNTIGLIGSSQSTGPLDQIKNKLQLSGGEFFLYWFIKQL